MKDLDVLLSQRDQYDDESKKVLDNLSFANAELESLKSMKSTEGWKLLEKKIREQLSERITILIKDDQQIQTLIALLSVADTSSIAKILDQAVQSFINN
jgi:hypothetical protein